MGGKARSTRASTWDSLKQQQGQPWLLIYMRKYGYGFPFYKFKIFFILKVFIFESILNISHYSFCFTDSKPIFQWQEGY